MSAYYDLYPSGNPRKVDEEQPLHARILPRGTITAKQFIELVSKANGFSPAILDGTLQAITDELQRWLAEGWIVEVGELGYFSLSLKCDRSATDKKEARTPAVHFNNVNLRLNKKYRNRFVNMKLERMESPYISHSTVNTEKAWKLLSQHLDTYGCITRADYARLTGRTKEQAIAELNGFLAKDLIRKYGSGKTVVYLAKKSEK